MYLLTLCIVDQRNGEQGGGEGLRERELLHKHQVPVPGNREHTRDESEPAETY